ncbi:MAG: hypothetical protein ACI84R_000598 [Candidatus Azotimanducaceae bacterium]
MLYRYTYTLDTRTLLLNVFIVFVTVFAGGALFYPKLTSCQIWRAAITPLASIIGSGFLVLGPILIASFSQYAPLIMAALCILAYAFGGAIRCNIARLSHINGARSKTENRLVAIAPWALAFAYIISVDSI